MNTREEECKDVAKDLMRVLNSMDNEMTRQLIEVLISEHRTIQQTFWRMIQTVIEEYAKLGEDNIDGRNKDSVVFCRGIMAELERRSLPIV